jgi:hypothetical protein
MKNALMMAVLAGGASVASADLLDFSDLAHGDIVAEQYASMGVHISAINPNRPIDIAMIFDTTSTGSSDDDLEDPWSMGNIPLSTELGNVLILQENDDLDPDDEGSRPAGSIIFDFDVVATSFGFDIIDVESATLEHSTLEFYIGGALAESIDFDEFEAGGSHDNGAIYGNNSINRISEFEVAGGFDRVIFNFGGSMAIDNIAFTSIPAPGSLALLGLGAAAAVRRRR